MDETEELGAGGSPSDRVQIVSNHIVIRHVQSGVHLCCTMLAVTFIYNKNRMV